MKRRELKITFLKSLLLIAAVLLNSTLIVRAQGLGGGKADPLSDKNLNRKQHLQDFYRSELRKGTLPDERRADYSERRKELEAEIKDIREKRLEQAERQKDKDPTILEAEILSAQFRQLDLSLADSAAPLILANEPKSLIFNAGVSFLSLDKYSAPFTVSAEKILSEHLSVGGYLGHLIEKVVDDKLYLDSNEYFTSNKANYKHTYVNFGVKASYHYFNPEFILPPTMFDLYGSVILGYTIAMGTHPFLDNEQFLPYDADGNTVDPGEGKSSFLNPNKKGLNYGVFAGLRYMYDDHVGFFVEAGYSNTAFGTIGATIRFLDRSTKIGPDGKLVQFKVKILSSSRQKDAESKAFKGVENAEEYKTKKEYIYVLTGENTSYESAKNLQVELSGGEFSRAEVVAIKDGQIIKLEKGKKLMGIVDKEPEVVEDPFKTDKKSKKKKKQEEGDENEDDGGDQPEEDE